MNEHKKHANLIYLESLIKQLLDKSTNIAYSNNFKHKYICTFSKGENEISFENKTIKDYYKFEVIIIDKSNIIESRINIYTAYYPTGITFNNYKIHETALQDFIFSSIGALSYFQYNEYQNKKNSTNENKIENKPKSNLIIT